MHRAPLVGSLETDKFDKPRKSPSGNTNQQPAGPAGSNNSKPCGNTRPSMVRAELMGSHTHTTLGGVQVHIWQRGEKYLVRGRWQGQAFGETLGRDPMAATSRLRKLITEIEDGTYIRPSDQPSQPVASRRHARMTVRQLVNEFLKVKRSERGLQTAGNYRDRLRPVLDFADRPEQLARWPQASSVNAEFVAALRTFLMTYETSRNGRKNSSRRLLSHTQVRHALETFRAVYTWALDPVTARLPASMLNPFPRGSIPKKPRKNPLRDDYLPLDLRTQLVGRMDEWQLCQLAWSLVLPLRPDEAEGLLIADVNIDKRRLEFGLRLKDCNFTKEQTQFVLPYPPEFDRLVGRCVQGRRAGPLLRNRRSFSRPERSDCGSEAALRESYESALIEAGSHRVQAGHDRKLVFRDVLRKRWGGVSKDRLTVEFKKLVLAATGREDWTLYDLRHAATQGMKDARLPLLELRYLTGHACNDILHQYSSVNPEAIKDYFASIRPLIDAVAARSEQLGLSGD